MGMGRVEEVCCVEYIVVVRHGASIDSVETAADTTVPDADTTVPEIAASPLRLQHLSMTSSTVVVSTRSSSPSNRSSYDLDSM